MMLNTGQLLEDAKAAKAWMVDQYTYSDAFEYPAEIEAIDRIIAYFEGRYLPPSEPGSYKDARGILDWSEGDEPAEVSIRRVRDEG